MANTFYPPVTSLITLDGLPEELGFIKDGLDALLGNLRYRDLQFTKSASGDTAFYSLIIVSKKKLEVEVPGTGVFIVFNPGHPGSGVSEIPFTISYQWRIISYLKNFNLANFSFQPGDFFDLALNVLGQTEANVINLLLSKFGITITQFVADVNLFYTSEGVNLPDTSASATPVSDLIAAIDADPNLDASASAVVFIVYLLDSLSEGNTRENLDSFFSDLIQPSLEEYLKDLIKPKLFVGINLAVAIEFPRNILLPLTMIGGEPLDDPARSQMLFSSVNGETFTFSTEEGIGFNKEVMADLTPSQIGTTGFELEINGAKLDVSRTRNIPEATADGRGLDFVGVYIKDATIKLPPYFNQEHSTSVVIKARNLLVGTGGISGTIGIEAISPTDPNPTLIKGCFGGGFCISLDAADITFRQNSIISSNIHGTMVIPGFKDSTGAVAELNIDVYIGEDGDFSVTVSEDQGINALVIEGILSIRIDSIAVGREDDRFYAELVGAVKFDDLGPPIGQFIPEEIAIQKLRIWEDGKIELQGGKITLPKAVSLKIGPVKLSVTAVGLGSHEQEHQGVLRQYKYFTFDGGINVNPGGVDVSGSGIALYWTTDNDVGAGLNLHLFMRIQSIAIDIIIPGNAKPADATLLLNGFLAMKETSSGTEYQGGVSFTLPKLKMGGSAAMRLNPKVPAFIIDVGLEMSTPILLGATGLGIYGFRGLVGMRYVATKNAAGVADTEPWWKYYKAKVTPDYKEGIQVSKFEQTKGFSLGAGISLATASDGGKAFSSKIFFLLSLPEVFLLQGQGQILKERIGLDTTADPPFFALIAITSSSVETAFGVNYKIPDDGDEPGAVATVDGVIEMGFSWGDAFAWYINIGKDEPENRRIQVRLLKLFNAYFYFMISNNGLRAGAGASFEVKKKFGPLKAELSAYLDTAGRFSRRPKEIGGSIQLGGTASLSIFGFGFSISAAASLAAESAKPFIVSGSVEVCVRVLRKDRCAKFKFTWTFRDALDLSETPLFKAPLSDSAKALNMQTRETFELWTGITLPGNPDASFIDNIVPMDSFIDIEFLKGVLPSAGVLANYGGNTMGSYYVEYVAPQRGKSDRVKHEYTVSAVDILYFNGSGTSGTWETFDIYGANTPLSLAPFVDPALLSTFKDGFWQYQAPNLHNKLRIMAQSPLSYVSQGSGGLVVEDLGITVDEIFCGPDPIEKCCVNFDTIEIPGQEMGSNTIPEDQLIFHEKFLFRVLGSDGAIINRPFQGCANAVQVDEGGSFELIFDEPQACVTLKMQTFTDGATVSAFRRVEIEKETGDHTEPDYEFELIGSATVLPIHDGTLNYESPDNPIDRIVIEAGTCKPKGDLLCDDTITQEGMDLLTFLDTLAERKQLVQNVKLEAEPYNVVFGQSSLYEVPAGCENPTPLWIPISSSNINLLVHIFDRCDFDCELELNLPKADDRFSFGEIRGFSNLRPDPELLQEGENFCFLIDAEMSDGRTVTLKGCACWNIINCELVGGDPKLVLDETRTAEADAFEGFIKTLAANNDLTKNRVNLSLETESKYGNFLTTSGLCTSVTSDRKLVIRPIEKLTGRKRLDVLLTETEVIEGGPIHEPGGGKKIIPEPNNNLYRCNFSIEQIAPRKNFSFGKVMDFENLRVNPSKIVEGENKEFLVDAVVRTKQNKVERITLQGESPINIINATLDPTLNSANVMIDAPEPHFNAGVLECGDITPEAKDLANFLNRLISTKFWQQSTGFVRNIYPDTHSSFNGYFIGTTLYPFKLQEQAVIPYSVTNSTETSIDFNVSEDLNKIDCDFHLEIIDDGGSGATKNQISSLFNLRPDPDNLVAGENYTFLIDAFASIGGARIPLTLRGTSCYNIVDCKSNTQGFICDAKLTAEGEQLGESLNSFFQFGLLKTPAAPMYPGTFSATFEGVFFGTVLYDTALVKGLTVDYTRTTLTETLVAWTIADNAGYSCDFQLEMITTSATAISDLVQLHNMRLDTDNLTEGENYTFLIDAYDQVGNVITMRGTSCYVVSNCAKECSTFIYQICVLNVEDALFNATIPTQTSVDEEILTLTNAFNGSIQPIWRPDTNYAIRITTTDKLNREGGSYLTQYNRQAIFGFRTMGPIGHFHLYRNDVGTPDIPFPAYGELEAVNKEDEFKLQNLLHYMDFPKCYPNADGQLINAKPLFYFDPKLLLYYTQNYVYEMLHSWSTYNALEELDIEFTATVIDPALDESETGTANEQGTLSWTLSDLPVISEDITILNNMMTYGDPCSTTTIIDPQYPVSNFQLPSLKPLKLYTAVFHLKYKRDGETDFVTREILRYPFQTSRYSTFADQVQSWQLFESEETGAAVADAVFIIEKPFDAVNNLAVAGTVLDNSMAKDDPLHQSFGNPYNRLIEGALKLDSIHPPQGTEFNLVRDTVTGNVVGILIKNPEPFNDPKVPIDDIVGFEMIEMTVNGGGAFERMISKDYSEIFISNSAMNTGIVDGDLLEFTFGYVQFDGVNYVHLTSETVSFNISL
jgi:hypothetical protein